MDRRRPLTRRSAPPQGWRRVGPAFPSGRTIGARGDGCRAASTSRHRRTRRRHRHAVHLRASNRGPCAHARRRRAAALRRVLSGTRRKPPSPKRGPAVGPPGVGRRRARPLRSRERRFPADAAAHHRDNRLATDIPSDASRTSRAVDRKHTKCGIGHHAQPCIKVEGLVLCKRCGSSSCASRSGCT